MSLDEKLGAVLCDGPDCDGETFRFFYNEKNELLIQCVKCGELRNSHILSKKKKKELEGKGSTE